MYACSEYYTPERLGLIKSAQNYQDFLGVALDILEEIARDNGIRPIAQVCGPISTGGRNSRKENLGVLSRAINKLNSDGIVVFNQMLFEDDMERVYKSDPSLQGFRLLEEFYLPIFQSGYISMLCFIPGWSASTGTRWEHERAKELNIPRIYLSDAYIID